MKKYRILFNPHAGNEHCEEEAKALEEKLAAENEVKVDDITKIPPYPEYFASLDPDEILVICGGDGTVNRFVNDCGELPANDISFYAAGTGNDFANDLGIKKGEITELKRYLQNLPEITVNGMTKKFINGIGYGIDGFCCEEGDRIRTEKPGKKINYTSIAIKGMIYKHKPANAEVIIDGEVRHFNKVWLAPTMKGRYMGGGMMLTPRQDRLDPDGKLSVMICHDAGKLKTLIMFPNIFTGEHLKYKDIIEVYTGKEITIRFDRPTPLQIDGETVTGVSEYSVKA